VVLKKLCEHVNGLSPAGWLNEQSITKHWFQSVRTCPYSWATGRNKPTSKRRQEDKVFFDEQRGKVKIITKNCSYNFLSGICYLLNGFKILLAARLKNFLLTVRKTC